MSKRLIPVVFALGLAGCSSMPFEYVEQREPAQTSLGTSIPPSASMAALPPAAGSVVSVIERKRGNALQHEVTLHGAPPNYGENQIIVTAFKYVSSIPEKPIEDTLPMKAPTEEDIINEMNERLTGGAVPISTNAPRNGAGPFAYAFGRRNGVSCLYAWQWLEGQNKIVNPPTAVRVRLCKPNTSEEVLVDHVRQLYLMPRTTQTQTAPLMAGGGGMRPYGDALSATRGGGAMAAYQPHPYGMGYGAPVYGAAQVASKRDIVDNAPVRRVAAAPVIKKRVLVRRVVRRKVVAPQIYSTYTPPPLGGAAVTAPVTAVPSAAPALRSVGPSTGYSAVPMPQ